MNVRAGTTVQLLLERLENQELDVLDAYGDKISGAVLVGTGAVFNLLEDGKRPDSVSVIVPGDLDGRGQVDLTDYMRIKSHFLGKYDLITA